MRYADGSEIRFSVQLLLRGKRSSFFALSPGDKVTGMNEKAFHH